MSRKINSSYGMRGSRILIVLLAFIALVSIPVQAHAPSEVALSYDQENQTLNVTTVHKVSSPAGHYVARVEIFKNDEKILSQDYTSQPSASGPFTYSYAVNASSGDVLKAKAFCSIAGSRSGELKVGENAKLMVQSSSSSSLPAGEDRPARGLYHPGLRPEPLLSPLAGFGRRGHHIRGHPSALRLRSTPETPPRSMPSGISMEMAWRRRARSRWWTCSEIPMGWPSTTARFMWRR